MPKELDKYTRIGKEKTYDWYDPMDPIKNERV